MGYETLKNIIEFNRAQPSIEEEALGKERMPGVRLSVEGQFTGAESVSDLREDL